MKKRFWALALVAMFAVTALCVAVGAADSPVQAAIIDSGTCGGEGDGSNLTWTLDSDGVLTISGNGAMADFDWSNQAPWNEKVEVIKEIIIEQGVTTIGYTAFYNCGNLESIFISDSVTNIGDSAFYFCDSINDVYYEGNEDQWEAIELGKYNGWLLDATIHYSSNTIDAPPTVVATPQSITVNGVPVNIEVYNIENSNYFKLRDVAMSLNGTGSQFSVGYDENTATISAVTGAGYIPIGGELAVGTDNSATCVASSQPLLVNGETVDLTAYNIGGYNFFKLRELGEALGFEVGYDAVENKVIIASWTQTGSFTVEGGEYGRDYSFSDRTLTILSDTPIKLKNADPNTPTTNTGFTHERDFAQNFFGA